jgi:hypothetical protein
MPRYPGHQLRRSLPTAAFPTHRLPWLQAPPEQPEEQQRHEPEKDAVPPELTPEGEIELAKECKRKSCDQKHTRHYTISIHRKFSPVGDCTVIESTLVLNWNTNS